MAGLATDKPRGPPMSSIDLLHQVVALMCEARDGGWEIACFQTGDFNGRDYFRVEFQRSPLPATEAEPSGRGEP